MMHDVFGTVSFTAGDVAKCLRHCPALSAFLCRVGGSMRHTLVSAVLDILSSSLSSLQEVCLQWKSTDGRFRKELYLCQWSPGYSSTAKEEYLDKWTEGFSDLVLLVLHMLNYICSPQLSGRE